MTYTWDTERRAFLDAQGHVVTRQDTDRWIEAMIAVFGAALALMAARYIAGKISFDTFQREFQVQAAASRRAMTVFANGGFEQMTRPAWAFAEGAAAIETAYVVRMMSQVARSGPRSVEDRTPAIAPAQPEVKPAISGPQLVDRSKMHAEGIYTVHVNATTNRERRAGVVMARRILEPSAEHCEDCPKFAEAGWQRIEDVPPIGESRCGARCRCYVQYERIRTPQNVEAVAVPEAA